MAGRDPVELGVHAILRCVPGFHLAMIRVHEPRRMLADDREGLPETVIHVDVFRAPLRLHYVVLLHAANVLEVFEVYCQQPVRTVLPPPANRSRDESSGGGIKPRGKMSLRSLLADDTSAELR